MLRRILWAFKCKLIINHRDRSQEDKQAADFEHWQLNEMESLSAYHLDYRVSKTLQDKCSAVHDVRGYL